MYWPSVLVTVQLFTTLYPTADTSSGQSTAQNQIVTKRFRVFLLVFIATFVYQFFPMLLFPTLTSIATLCLLNNESWWMRTMGSGYNGAGMFNFSLDWSSIGTSNPLYTPYWALGNYYGGLIAVCWIVSSFRISDETYADEGDSTHYVLYQFLVRFRLYSRPD
jgi:hypothetical protein